MSKNPPALNFDRQPADKGVGETVGRPVVGDVVGWSVVGDAVGWSVVGDALGAADGSPAGDPVGLDVGAWQPEHVVAQTSRAKEHWFAFFISRHDAI
jgi:hypothetical protein